MVELILQNYRRDLALRGYSPRTQNTYYRNIIWFLEYCKEPPGEVTKETIKNYLYYLIRDRKLSESSLRQARSAICYFFSQTMGRDVEVENIPIQKKKRKLPEVFTVEEVFRIIHCAENIKHKTILMLTYSSGLRVGEIVNIKVSDIARESMRLKVRDAKGGKDRYTLLSNICLNQLEQYWKIYRPDNWLFCGRIPGTQMSIRAVQHAYQRAKNIAGITKQCGIHTLRHSFATHMIETGSGIFQLQKFLGHRHLNTILVRSLFLNGLKELYRSGKLYLQGTVLSGSKEFQAMIDDLFISEWIVYLKESFQGNESVIEYLARYTHRIAISNHRIVSVKDGMVRFRYRDYKDENKEKILKLPALSFIHRFMLHVVPKRFVRIRYFGLLSHRNKKKAFEACRGFYGIVKKQDTIPQTWSEIYLRVTGKNISCCPACKTGRLIVKEILEPVRYRSPPECLCCGESVSSVF